MFVRNGVWHICIRHNGKKIQKSLKIPVGKKEHERIAEVMEAKIKVQLIEETYFDKPIGCKKTFKELMDKFMKEHAPKVSSSMQRSYKTSLKHLIPFFGDLNLTLISRSEISKYKVLRKGKGITPATINRETAMISKAFSLAVEEWEWLRHKPFLKIPQEKENNKRDRWLAEGEEKRLLENCPHWLREIVVFALNTGVRQEESLSLKWSAVNLLRKTALINNTKNGKPRTIPLNKIALGVLVERSKVRSFKNDFVFFNRNGKKINAHNLRTSFYIVLRKSGIVNFRWHDLRHSFCTKLSQRGVDLYKIAKLAGHEDISITQRYSHHCPESLRDGVEVLESDYVLTTVGENGLQNLS